MSLVNIQAKVDLLNEVGLPLAVSGNGSDGGGVGDGEDDGSAPSPQSEAVTNELQELTLQSNNGLSPFNRRKNGFSGVKLQGSKREKKKARLMTTSHQKAMALFGTEKPVLIIHYMYRTEHSSPPGAPEMGGQVSEVRTSARLRRQCYSTFSQQEERLLQVLQLKLQQRRTREELASQGIMPPLKSPAAFHEQRRSLERARTEDYLKRKIRSRPERAELVRMHILEDFISPPDPGMPTPCLKSGAKLLGKSRETSAEPSLQATQMKLKRARLADDLNEKIAQRPGPMELVEKNILPVDSSVKEAIVEPSYRLTMWHLPEDKSVQPLTLNLDNHVPYSVLADNSSFDEDSSDALSPEQPGSQESLGSLPSPTETRAADLHHLFPASSTQYLISLPTGTELSKLKAASDQQMAKLANGVPSPTAKPMPTLIKQSQPKTARDKNQRSKKLKEPKSRVKKLKYHQYVPPDQKLDKATLPLDTAYSKLLQQQQLFLQLQILCQQQHYNYQTILPAPPKPNSDQQTKSSAASVMTLTNSTPSSGSGGLTRQNSCTSTIKPPTSLPSNLDDLKVAELKQELKLRALPVSGTKTDLIERLKNYQEQNKGGGTPSTMSKAGSATLKPTEVMVSFPSALLSSTPAVVTSVTSGDAMVTTVSGSSAVKLSSTSSTPPVSPAPSDRSVHSMEESMTPEAFTESLQSSPMRVVGKEEPSCINGMTGIATLVSNDIRGNNQESSKDTQATTKDLMLQEKDKQIEELTRMLRQKQQLVEALRLQLYQEKRIQLQQPAAGVPLPVQNSQKIIPITIKQESPLSSCPRSAQSTHSGSNKSISLLNHIKPPKSSPNLADALGSNLVPMKALVVKQETCAGPCEQPTMVPAVLSPTQSNQVTTGAPTTISQNQAPNLLANGVGTHILLTMTPQSNNVHRVSPTVTAAKGQPAIQVMPSPPSQGQAQQPMLDTQSKQQQPPAGLMKQAVKKEQRLGLQLVTGTSGAVLSYSFTPSNVQPSFANNVTESSLKAKVNGMNNGPSSTHKDNSRSQQMDDLFDILIESGEISLNAKDVSTSLNTPSPQNVSPTLAMSPPAAVKVQLPSSQLFLEPISDSQSSNQESRLEDFLVSTTGVPLLSVDDDGTEPLSLIDDLHNQMLSSSSILEHPHSPMDTSDLHFATDSTSLTLDLADTNLDNMEWLDLSMGSSSVGLAPLSSVAPSVFSTDFLDSHDLQLHWD